MFPFTRLTVATSLSLVMCAALVCASAMPPVRTLPEEHETQQASQREIVEREQLPRERKSFAKRHVRTKKHCLFFMSGSAHRHSTRLFAFVTTELSERNGIGAPLRL